MKINHIISVVDSQIILRMGQDGIAKAFKVRFYEIYKSAKPSSAVIDTCLEGLEIRVTKAMNESLQRDFTKGEVEEALKMIGPLKSPGSNGFGACFYHSFWNIIGDDVCGAALKFLNGGGMEQSLNHSHVALIPKVIDPKTVSDFRPINLCNVMYKIIAKALANRLKMVLNDITSKS